MKILFWVVLAATVTLGLSYGYTDDRSDQEKQRDETREPGSSGPVSDPYSPDYHGPPPQNNNYENGVPLNQQGEEEGC